MSAQVRIRRYKPHGSHLWVMCFPDPTQQRATAIDFDFRRMVNNHAILSGDIAGVAAVVWAKDGSTTALVRNWSNMPGILIPDMVRNRLLADKIEDWTLDSIYGANR